MLRRSWALALCLSLTLPTMAYEVFQKTAELVGPRSTVLRLSQRAEIETRWRPVTGLPALDHTLHEMAETRRFYRMAGRHLTLHGRPDRAPGRRG